MKILYVLFFGIIITTSSSVFAQSQSPVPVIETDVRENSTVMRSYEIERLKRDAAKPRQGESTLKREIKLAEIKEDFEAIQKLQDLIIKFYTTGEKINYRKISEAAAEMRKKALRLNSNLFGEKSVETNAEENADNAEKTNVRNLIIELDNTIGLFTKSSIFKNINVVDVKTSETAQSHLKRILDLSKALSLEADKMK